MTTPALVTRTTKLIKANAPEILTALGASGVVTTSYLSARASFKAAGKLESTDPHESFKEKTKRVWKCYIPAGISGAATITCIIMAGRGSNRRAAAAATAYSLTERAFSEYREKVTEQIGVNKAQAIRDDIAQDRINANPHGGKDVLVVGEGNVLCCDMRSMRYFRSSMESLKRAENEINFQLNHERYVSLSEFYIVIGLPITKESVTNGWNLDRGLMELDFSTTLAENNEPCLTFDFNYCSPLHSEPFDPDAACRKAMD